MKINRSGKQFSVGIALISYLFLLILITTHSHDLKWQDSQLYEEIGNTVTDNLLMVDGTCIFQFNGLFNYDSTNENNKDIIIISKTGNNRIIPVTPHKNIFTGSAIWLRGPPRSQNCSI